MLRRLISSLRSWLGSASEPDTEGRSTDVEAAIAEVRLRDQQLRNRAARAIAGKMVLAARIRETATSERFDVAAFTSLLERYREAWDEAEASKDAIGENVAALREIKTQHPAVTGLVDEMTGVISTSIEDETPSPESLEALTDRRLSEAPGRGDPEAGGQPTPDAVNMAAGEAGLETLRPEHDR